MKMSEEMDTSGAEPEIAQSAEQAQPSESFAIPEQYADRGWASKVKSQDDLFKQIDNLDSMIGKRESPPESPDNYELSLDNIEGLPEDVDLSEFNTKAQNVMHEAGLTQKQAQKLYELYLKEELNVANENKQTIEERQKELDEQFDQVTQELFGDKFEEVSVKSQNVIKDTVPENLIPHLQNLADTDPKALAAVIALTDGMSKQMSEIKRKYGEEDSLFSGGQAQASQKDEILKQLTETKAKVKNADPFSPERKNAENQIQELRKQLQGFFN